MPARAKNRTPSPLMGALRYLFAKHADPYAGADLDRAKKLGAIEWFGGALVVLILLPLSPPTHAIGAAGWAVGGLVILSSLGACVRLRRMPERVGVNELLAMSYVAVISIGVIEWLAGGRATPYHQLYLLSVVYTATVHPGRRVIPYFATFLVVINASLLYGPASASNVGDVWLQAMICLAMAMMGLVLMAGVRAQRLALQAEGDAERELALTDPLTGLGNRRRLVADLEAHAAAATSGSPVVLALFDLDGFKAYNDTFGHPAGDALLKRVAGALRESVGSGGRAYRMGGDEFCVLAPVAGEEPKTLAAAWRAALNEEGEGFTITASAGWIVLPDEMADAEGALRGADRRMYAAKSLSRSSAGRQSTDVLMRVLAERDALLSEHSDAVVELAATVGRALALPADELAALRGAAALHDIGMVGVPESIVRKPGPLAHDEWEFIRSHPLVGERILGSAPALAAAARLVRSIHERVDGRGYPDALRGEEIPLGSRIVAACEAYVAMVSDRPYRAALSHPAALAELRAGADTQFDPSVVEALVPILAEQPGTLREAAA